MVFLFLILSILAAAYPVYLGVLKAFVGTLDAIERWWAFQDRRQERKTCSSLGPRPTR